MGHKRIIYRLLQILLSVRLLFLTQGAFLSSSFRTPRVPSRRLLADTDDDTDLTRPHLIFPGGGIFFYWQAGAVTYMKEQGYSLSACTLSGASAGALSATLAATDVDYYRATDLALDMAAASGVWDRSGGLQGIWGPMIYNWLDELLPVDAVELVPTGRLSLLVTPVPSFGKESVNEFQSREDLIHCNMASIHLPWFLDGRLVTTDFRDRPYMDGSFLSKRADYLPSNNSSKSRSLILDYNLDPKYKSKGLIDFVQAMSPDGIYQMLEDGKRYAASMEERGLLSSLPKLPERGSLLRN